MAIPERINVCGYVVCGGERMEGFWLEPSRFIEVRGGKVVKQLELVAAERQLDRMYFPWESDSPPIVYETYADERLRCLGEADEFGIIA